MGTSALIEILHILIIQAALLITEVSLPKNFKHNRKSKIESTSSQLILYPADPLKHTLGLS